MKFKKFIAILLTAITAACIAVGFSGCKEEIKLPPMTETAPVVATWREMDYYIEIYDDCSSLKRHYECFVDYYNGEFKQVCGEKFYYLNSNRVEPEEQRWFHIWLNYGISILVKKGSSKQNSLVEPVIYEYVTVNDINVGDSRDNGSVAPWTIRFFAYFRPIKEDISGELSLKFGKKGEKKNKDFYINIYFGETCIGTVYFDTNVSISYEWFEDFFTRHLVYGD